MGQRLIVYNSGPSGGRQPPPAATAAGGLAAGHPRNPGNDFCRAGPAPGNHGVGGCASWSRPCGLPSSGRSVPAAPWRWRPSRSMHLRPARAITSKPWPRRSCAAAAPGCGIERQPSGRRDAPLRSVSITDWSRSTPSPTATAATRGGSVTSPLCSKPTGATSALCWLLRVLADQSLRPTQGFAVDVRQRCHSLR